MESCDICDLNGGLDRYLVEDEYGWAKQYFSPHTFVNGICSDCGYSDDASTAHNLTGWSLVDGSSHSRSCTDPGCGYAEKQPHGVWYRYPFSTNPAGHKVECALCGTSPNLVPHEFGDWEDESYFGHWMGRWCRCGYQECCVPEEDLWFAFGEANYAHTHAGGFCSRCGIADEHTHFFGWESNMFTIDNEYCGAACETCDYSHVSFPLFFTKELCNNKLYK